MITELAGAVCDACHERCVRLITGGSPRCSSRSLTAGKQSSARKSDDALAGRPERAAARVFTRSLRVGKRSREWAQSRHLLRTNTNRPRPDVRDARLAMAKEASAESRPRLLVLVPCTSVVAWLFDARIAG